MSTIINIAVDATLTATWWVVRRTSYGLYSGIHYLIYGNSESQTDTDRRMLIEKIDKQDLLLIKLSDKLDEINNKTDDEKKNSINLQPPPPYTKHGFQIVG